MSPTFQPRLHAQSLHSCLILCNSMDRSPPGFSVGGISQARALQWVARPSSRGSFQPRDRTFVSYVSCIGDSSLITSITWEAPSYREPSTILSEHGMQKNAFPTMATIISPQQAPLSCDLPTSPPLEPGQKYDRFGEWRMAATTP